MTDIADKEHGATMQSQCTTVHRGVGAVLIQFTGQCFTTLLKGLNQSAIHQAHPVFVAFDFFLRIHRRHRIFTVLNRRHSRLKHDVFHARRIVLTDEVIVINLDFNMQIIVFQKHR